MSVRRTIERLEQWEADQAVSRETPTTTKGMNVSKSITAAQLHAEAAQASHIAAELRRQATIAAKAERDAKRPAMPEAGSIVIFTRYQSGRAYQYAAVSWRVGEHVRWAVTGAEARQFNWPGLLGFIGEINWDTIAVVTGSKHLVAPGDEPAAAETVGRYGRRTTHVLPDEIVEPWHGKAGAYDHHVGSDY